MKAGARQIEAEQIARFADMLAATGMDGEVLNSFRKIRDQIQNRMRAFYDSEIRYSGR